MGAETEEDVNVTFSTELRSLGEAQGRLEARIEDAVRSQNALDKRFEGLRIDLAATVVTRKDLQQGIDDLAGDVAEAIAATKGDILQRRPSQISSDAISEQQQSLLKRLVEENQQSVVRNVEAWQAAFEKELALHQTRLAEELQAEV